MARSTKPKLAVVGAQSAGASPAPPTHLGEIGADLWRDIVAAYEFEDRASYETLAQACAAADRAASCAEQIAEDGVLIKTRAGVRDHPLIKHEIAARSFVVRTLARLGLDLEPIRSSVGRPPGVA